MHHCVSCMHRVDSLVWGFLLSKGARAAQEHRDGEHRLYMVRETVLYSWELFLPHEKVLCCHNLRMNQSRNVTPR